jgi:hypothetical protein
MLGLKRQGPCGYHPLDVNRGNRCRDRTKMSAVQNGDSRVLRSFTNFWWFIRGLISSNMHLEQKRRRPICQHKKALDDGRRRFSLRAVSSTSVCSYICTLVCMCACICTYVCVCVYVTMYACICTYVCVYMYLCMCVYKYISTYACTSTYVHIYICRSRPTEWYHWQRGS